MNPQLVSLADELRKLEQKWRRTYEEGQPIGSKGAFTYDIEKRCADELSALLRQHAVAESKVSVPMREWLQAKRVELSAEQLWAVESYLVMNVLPVAPAHAAEQPKLTASRPPCRLDECPPGAFLFHGALGMKTEYGSEEIFVVDSGEYFWGGTSTSDKRYALIVQPVDLLTAPVAPTPQSENLASLSRGLTKMPPLAPEEQPPRHGMHHEAIKHMPPAPPVQERESDELRASFKNIVVAETQTASADGQWAVHTNRVMYAFDKVLATAAKAAKEAALREAAQIVRKFNFMACSDATELEYQILNLRTGEQPAAQKEKP